MRRALVLTVLSLAAITTKAQWDIQNAHTRASLRGIHSLGKGIAWASGTGGTVLRTEDGGYLWQLCTTPPGAEHLDFRGIQAFDNNTAIVMSSGKGDLSRLYKTTDGCQTWNLILTNPDKDGFFDALMMNDLHNGWLLGDPVDGNFVIDETNDGAATFSALPRTANWKNISTNLHLESGDRGAFAASNSSLVMRPLGPVNPCRWSRVWFGTGGPGGAKVFRMQTDAPQCSDWVRDQWFSADVPIAGQNASSGVFSLAVANDLVLVAVGGDYLKPKDSTGTAAFTRDGGKNWEPATTPPHGYRSAVAYDTPTKTWITVGPNGTDISTDDGRNWRALQPSPNDAPDADKNWNALSLPFVVGPYGRIGVLRPGALTAKP